MSPKHTFENPSTSRSRPPARAWWRGLLSPPEFYRERREVARTPFESIFEPAVLVLAIVLFTNGLLQLGLAAAPNWATAGLLPVTALAALGAHLYSRRLARGVILLREWIVLLVPFLVAIRFLPYLAGERDLAADVAAWLAAPSAFFDAGFVVAALVLVGAWITSFASTQNLNDLRVQAGELSRLAPRTIVERAMESDRIRSIDHTTPFRSLVARFTQGGIGLIVVSALTASSVPQRLSVDAVAELVSFNRASSSLALVNVVAYFVAMLALIVEAQLARYRTLWQIDGVPVVAGLARAWAAAGAVLIGAGLLAALLVPTEGLLGLADIVHLAITAITNVGYYAMLVFYLLLWLITYPLRWLFADADGAVAPPPPLPTPVAVEPAGGGSILDTLRSVVFWLVVGGVLLYSFVVLGQRTRLGGYVAVVLGWLGRLGAAVLGALGLALAWLGQVRRRLAVAVGGLIAPVVGQVARAAARLPRRPGGRHDPRGQVLALYELLLARAAARGVARRPDETASELAVSLGEHWPTVESDVDGLTDLFIDARYSRHEIAAPEVSRARQLWTRIRTELRALPRAER